MTSTGSLIKTFWRQKARIIHGAVGIELIFIILTGIYNLFKGSWSDSLPSSLTLDYGSVAGFVVFVLLAQKMERNWVANSYRLIPTSDTKLYCANVAATFLSYLYFMVLQVILLAVSALKFFIDGEASFDFPAEAWQYLLGGALIFLSLLLFAWVFITLIHFLTTTISAFLPTIRQKLFRFILIIAVIIITLIAANWIDTGAQAIFQWLLSGLGMAAPTDANILLGLYLSAGYLLLSVIVMSAINVYLLKHWVETKTSMD